MNHKPCKTCIFWDSGHPRLQFAPTVQGVVNPGFCRKHKPGAYAIQNEQKEMFHIGVQPIMDADEGCAERREIE